MSVLCQTVCISYIWHNLKFLCILFYYMQNIVKKIHYNNLIRLSNEVLMPNITAVSGQDKEFGYRIILQRLQTFYGPAFEDIYIQYVQHHRRVKEIGSWWANRTEC